VTPEFARRVPEADGLERNVCTRCGYVAYENPKVVVGSVVSHDGRILLCKRAIEPRLGFWTLPAGYMELGETLEQGAIREAREEAEAAIALEGVLALYSLSRIDQVMVVFRAAFEGEPRFSAGAESLEADLFAWEDVPWNDLAFPSVAWALHAWRAADGAPLGAPAGAPASPPG
jgi:ADP-ribose pyrophosphatase YjhB (NUDIX family)